MKKCLRILKNQEFSDIISRKKFVKTPAFVLYYQPAKGNHSRIGISVGKKIGNAVIRNKTKRQVRAMIDEVFSFEEPFDAIIIVRPPYLKQNFSALKDMLAKARKKACASMHQGESNEKNTA